MLLSLQRNRTNKKIIMALSLFFVMGAIFLLPNLVSAQDPDLWGGGTPGVNEESLRAETGLGSSDPRIVAARVIQIALGFLAIITVSLIIYGGWMYMTSEGNEEKIEKAKKILKNAVIGLIIILSAFGIASFILGKLTSQSTFRSPGAQGGPGFRSGFGAIGSCSVESVYPEDMANEIPRNTSIIVTFKEEIDPSTICDIAEGAEYCDGDDMIIDHVKIYAQDQKDNCFGDNKDACISAKVYSNDNKTFTFIPNNYLGSASEYIWYEVYMTNDIQIAATGAGVFDKCRSNLNWIFEVSNKLDLIPPQVTTVFPGPDNWADEFYDSGEAMAAKGSIIVNSIPKVLIKSSFGESVPSTGSEDASLIGEFSCTDDDCPDTGTISVSIEPNGASSTASGVICAAGTQDIVNNQVEIGCGLTLISEADDGLFTPGNSWTIDFIKGQEPDKLNVGGTFYTFVASNPKNNEIQIGVNKNKTADNIAQVLNTRSDISAISSGSTVNIQAKTAGESGNNIVLASESSALSIDAQEGKLYGGVDRVRREDVYGRKDKPRNAVIQINFNEAMMPMAVSGNADDVADYLRVVNASSTAKAAGETCTDNDQCQSFKCNNNTCENDYLAGNFEISNGYKTVEFIPSTPCEGEAGVNACGGRVYCLPGNANIRLELKAADLVTCGSNSDCTARSPYVNCNGGICQDSSDPVRNYPLGNSDTGITDSCLNSLDGDRNSNAEGHNINFYNENSLYGLCGGTSLCTNELPDDFVVLGIDCTGGACIGAQNLSVLQNTQGDDYAWSFYISNEIAVGAPIIETTKPGLDSTNVNLSEPIKAKFNTLLMASTLRTGGIETIDPVSGEPIPHRRVNLWNYTESALGYWVSKEDVDDPRDNEPDYTIVNIDHSLFSDAETYRVQFGSGIYDIYQNCYLPSDGPYCSGITKEKPSCCNGVATQTLDDQGSCE